MNGELEEVRSRGTRWEVEEGYLGDTIAISRREWKALNNVVLYFLLNTQFIKGK
jgi:hypothetical protein